MPRITKQQYLDRHHLLRKDSLEASVRLGNLTTTQQWALHAYYLPRQDLTDQELLDHRGLVTAQRPSLPNTAGKAFAALQTGRASGIIRDPVIIKGKMRGSRISVRAMARPEPDVEKLAKALLYVARQIANTNQPNERIS